MNHNPMALTHDDLEKQKQAAADKGDFESWQAANKLQTALRGGKSYINGQPAAVALGGQVAPTVAQDAPLPQSDPNKTAYEVEMIKKYGPGGVKATTLAQNEGLQTSKYNQFLMDQGISPDTIGNATISENGELDAPSLNQVQTATDIANKIHGVHNQYSIAANRAIRDRNPALGLQLQQDAAEVAPQVAQGRSAYGNLQYWLNRLRGQVQTAQSNGYASRPPAVSYANQLP